MKKNLMLVTASLSLLFASVASAQNLRIQGIHNLFGDDLGKRGEILHGAMGSGGGFFHNPTWSPNGTKIAFDFSAYDEPTSVWIVNSNGTGLHKISDRYDEHPSWSPDGERIVCVRYNTITNEHEIWVMSANGTNQILLTRGVDPAWGPTGKIAFVQRGLHGFPSIWTIDSDGNGLTQVTDSPDPKGDPSWSPDGRWIAFSQIQSGQENLWVIGLDGAGLRQLTRKGGQKPSWSSDGNWIVFVSDRWREKADLWAVRSDKAEDAVHLSTGAGWSVDMPAWSPDGKKILFNAVYEFNIDEGLYIAYLE